MSDTTNSPEREAEPAREKKPPRPEWFDPEMDRECDYENPNPAEEEDSHADDEETT